MMYNRTVSLLIRYIIHITELRVHPLSIFIKRKKNCFFFFFFFLNTFLNTFSDTFSDTFIDTVLDTFIDTFFNIFLNIFLNTDFNILSKNLFDKFQDKEIR